MIIVLETAIFTCKFGISIYAAENKKNYFYFFAKIKIKIFFPKPYFFLFFP